MNLIGSIILGLFFYFMWNEPMTALGCAILSYFLTEISELRKKIKEIPTEKPVIIVTAPVEEPIKPNTKQYDLAPRQSQFVYGNDSIDLH